MHSQRVRCRHGSFAHLQHDALVREALERYGEWAEAEIYLLTRFLRPGDVVVDAGAHVGTHSAAFCHAVGPSGSVVAIEAEPSCFELLRENLAASEAVNADCRQALLGARDGGTRTLPGAAQGNVGATSFIWRARVKRRDSSRFRVASRTLDSLDIPAPRLLKIDVEAMEMDVLRGGLETIRRHRPVIYYEQTSSRGFLRSQILLRRLGYQLFWHYSPAFNQNNFRGSSENIFGGAGDRNIVAVPTEEDERRAHSRATLIPLPSNQIRFRRPEGDTEPWALPERPYSFYANGSYWTPSEA